MPPKHPTVPAVMQMTGTYRRSTRVEAMISAIAANPRLASWSRTPPVSRSMMAFVWIPFSLSAQARSSAAVSFSPETSPMLPPRNAPSIAITTVDCPEILPFITTQPSSACGVIPCIESQGDSTRSKGPSNSRDVPVSKRNSARSRALSSIKLCRLMNFVSFRCSLIADSSPLSSSETTPGSVPQGWPVSCQPHFSCATPRT